MLWVNGSLSNARRCISFVPPLSSRKMDLANVSISVSFLSKIVTSLFNTKAEALCGIGDKSIGLLFFLRAILFYRNYQYVGLYTTHIDDCQRPGRSHFLVLCHIVRITSLPRRKTTKM